jgi:hypothetical protein
MEMEYEILEINGTAPEPTTVTIAHAINIDNAMWIVSRLNEATRPYMHYTFSPLDLNASKEPEPEPAQVAVG